MRIPLHQIDAFADRPFTGNPAAVCPLPAWLPDATLQAIAAENNLAETAFYVPEGEGYRLRWFTPTTEVELCGHATLASAHVILEESGGDRVAFQTLSGRLEVRRAGDLLTLDFPVLTPKPCPVPPTLTAALGHAPIEVLAARDYLCVLEDEAAVRDLAPDLAAIAGLDKFAVIVTAPGRSHDFVSRFFAPAKGVPEDPVTGSAHCTLTPYWAGRLGKTRLTARQLSRRGGDLVCELSGDRVLISGRAVRFLRGEIELPA